MWGLNPGLRAQFSATPRAGLPVLEAPVPDLPGDGVGRDAEPGLHPASERHQVPFLHVVPINTKD